jgi:hypothetical protein
MTLRHILRFLVASIALTSMAEDEILVGRNSAGQLQVHVEFDQPLELPVSVFSGISGYATGEVGLHSTLFDDPANDFFQLSTEADFRFILLAKDTGMEVWNDHGSAFMTNGEMFYIGPSPFDTHPVWNLVDGVPGTAYSLTLKIRDLNGIYPDSDPFTLSFTAAAAPGPFELQISQTGASEASVTWPTNAFGWDLESTAALETTNWASVTNARGLAGTNFSITIPTTNGSQFFRLRRL